MADSATAPAVSLFLSLFSLCAEYTLCVGIAARRDRLAPDRKRRARLPADRSSPLRSVSCHRRQPNPSNGQQPPLLFPCIFANDLSLSARETAAASSLIPGNRAGVYGKQRESPTLSDLGNWLLNATNESFLGERRHIRIRFGRLSWRILLASWFSNPLS